MVLCGLVSCIDRTGVPERKGAWDPFLADTFDLKISYNCCPNTGTLPSNIKLPLRRLKVLILSFSDILLLIMDLWPISLKKWPISQTFQCTLCTQNGRFLKKKENQPIQNRHF